MKLLNNLKFKQKLLTIFIIAFLLPFLLLAFMLVVYLYSTLSDLETTYADYDIIQVESVLDDLLFDIYNLSNFLYVNEQLLDIIFTEFENTKEVFNAYRNLGFLNNLLNTNRGIANFRIYVKNPTLLDNSFLTKLTPEIENTDWYISAVEKKGYPFWTYKKDNITGKNYLCMVRSVWDTINRNFVGVLVININPDYINKNLNMQMFSTMITHNDRIIYSSTSANSSEKNVKVISKEYKMQKGDSYDLQIIRTIPVERLTRTTTGAIKLILIFLVLCVFLVTLIIFFVGMNLSNRVKKIQDSIMDVATGKFDIPPEIDGKDEFSDIYSTLYGMSCDIKKLIDEVYIRNIEKEQLLVRQHDIKFKMLSSQINPHFLFNTLESIRMKALVSNDTDVAYMLKILSKILRYNLSVKNDIIPLYSDLENVSDYLDIQHMRFANRVTFDIVTMCDARKIGILPLLIQPIVENSFKHGLEKNVTEGFIYITATTLEKENRQILSVQVKDNGCGINSEKLESLNKRLNTGTVEDTTSSIGLLNIQHRIRLFYGEGYGLNIESTEGKGTVVTMNIPIVNLQEEKT